MKKLIFFCLLFCASTVFANSYTKVIFFGDSLTDDGNTYKLLWRLVPKSPPYFKGRFTNGPTWAEEIGRTFYNKYYIDYKIYAYGGATAILHKITKEFFSPMTLDVEINNYLIDNLVVDKSNALFVVWIGANDYLFDRTSDIDSMSSRIVDRTADGIKKLITYGARNFLILNLPELSASPFSKKGGHYNRYIQSTHLHNKKLTEMVISLKNEYRDLSIVQFDIYKLFNDVVSHPDVYDEKYHVHITNRTDSCWSGGYIYKEVDSSDIASSIQQQLATTTMRLNDKNNLDVNLTSQYIANLPDLREAYMAEQAYLFGKRPCANPNAYMFWDGLHPTAIIHKILGSIIMEFIEGNDVIKPRMNRMAATASPLSVSHG